MRKQNEVVGVNEISKLKELLNEANKNLELEHSLAEVQKNKNYEAIRTLKKQLIQ